MTTNSFTYNGANDLLTLTDGKNQTTSFGIDLYGNATNKIDAAGNLVLVNQFDADNRRKRHVEHLLDRATVVES